MCHHLDRHEWEAIREAAREAEPTEATDEADPAEEPAPLAPTADD